MKSLSTLCFLMFAWGQVVVKAQEMASLADLIERVEPSVVRIETSDGIGSGFVATNDGTVVTNLHVIAGNSEATIKFQDGRSYSVVGVLVQDEERDLAILKTDCSGANLLVVSSELPRKGDEVVTFGAPAGLSFSASEGIISGMRSGNDAKTMLEKDTGTWLQTTAPISPGNSGGPLVNRKGEVVGVNTFYVNRGQNLNFAISCVDIAELLLKAKQVPTPKPLSEATASMTRQAVSQPDDKLLAAPIRAYIDASKETATSMIAEVKGQVENLQTELTLMKSGRINKRLEYPSSTGYRREVIRNKAQYFFFTEEIKAKTLEAQATRLSELKSLQEKMSDSGRGLVLVAMVAGPKLSLSSPGSIGRIMRIRVSQVTGSDSFHGYVGDTRVAVEGVQTSTLLSDQTLEGGIFHFSGVEAYETRLGTENRIARLTYVSNESFLRLGSDLYPESEPLKPSNPVVEQAEGPKTIEPRTWKDQTGKFSITATFVRIDGYLVELSKQTGETIKVPITKLSSTDQEWLKSQTK